MNEMIRAVPRLTPADLTTLRQVFRHGVTRAAAGVSTMVGKTITVTDVRVEALSFGEATALAGTPERPAVGIYLGITGPIGAHVVLLLDPDDAATLARLLLGDLVEAGAVAELAGDALGEVGNVIGSSIGTVLGDLVGTALWSTTPAVQTDMAASLVDGLVASASNGDDQVLVILTCFEQTGSEMRASVKGTFLVIPESASVSAILDAVGRNGR